MIQYISNKTTILSYSISDEITEIEKNTNLFVGKIFQNWEYVEKFMKKYATVKGHEVRISGGGRIDKTSNEVIK